VDDDPALIKLLSLRLEANGFDVDTAANGREALARLGEVQPQVLVTDLRMDEMDGMALFEAVRQRHPGLPVIILTAHGTIPDAVEAAHKGVFGYLTKPFEARELLERIEQALQQSATPPPQPGAGDWCAGLLHQSAAMEELLEQAWRIARSDAAVFIRGESGTGKELLARAIHRASPRAEGPFVAINCAAIPEHLVEAELFGHRKGAFTGADRDRAGLFEAAHGGTLFLDEVGDLPAGTQAKLLRVLQEGEIRPVGASESRPVDVRILSASHVDLHQAVSTGRFREDLYYRLDVMTLELPPLRERREDIPLLAGRFLQEVRERSPECVARAFAPEAMEALLAAPWPGNVRQLRNVVEQTAALAVTPVISLALVQRALRGKVETIIPLAQAHAEFERDYLIRVLRMTRGNVTRAARLAGRNRTEFYKLLKRHRLEAARFRKPEPKE